MKPGDPARGSPDPPWKAASPRSPEGAAPSRGRAPPSPPAPSPRPRPGPAAPRAGRREAGRRTTLPAAPASRGPGWRAPGAAPPPPRGAPRPAGREGDPAHPEAPPGLRRRLPLLPRRRTFPPARPPRARLHLPLRQPRRLRGPRGRGAAAAGGLIRGRAPALATGGGRGAAPTRCPRAPLRGVRLPGPGGAPWPKPAGPGMGTRPETRGPLQVGGFARDWSPRSGKVAGRG